MFHVLYAGAHQLSNVVQPGTRGANQFEISHCNNPQVADVDPCRQRNNHNSIDSSDRLLHEHTCMARKRQDSENIGWFVHQPEGQDQNLGTIGHFQPRWHGPQVYLKSGADGRRIRGTGPILEYNGLNGGPNSMDHRSTFNMVWDIYDL